MSPFKSATNHKTSLGAIKECVDDMSLVNNIVVNYEVNLVDVFLQVDNDEHLSY